MQQLTIVFVMLAAAVVTPRSAAAASCGDLARLRSEEHTSELQSRLHLVCRLLLEKKNNPPPSANPAVNTGPAERGTPSSVEPAPVVMPAVQRTMPGACLAPVGTAPSVSARPVRSS